MFLSSSCYIFLYFSIALHGCKDVVHWLLESCQHPVDAEDSCGNTPLMDAIRMGHTEVAAMMIQDFKVSVSSVNSHSLSPTH